MAQGAFARRHPCSYKARLFIKTQLASLGLIAVLACASCRRADRDADLPGSWRVSVDGVTQTYQFATDHAFTATLASSKDLRYFGNWAINRDELIINVRSNSFSPTIVNHRETAHIARLSATTLVLKDRDRNDQPRERVFRKLN